MFEKREDIYTFKHEELSIEGVEQFSYQFRSQCTDELDLIMTELVFYVQLVQDPSNMNICNTSKDKQAHLQFLHTRANILNSIRVYSTKMNSIYSSKTDILTQMLCEYKKQVDQKRELLQIDKSMGILLDLNIFKETCKQILEYKDEASKTEISETQGGTA